MKKKIYLVIYSIVQIVISIYSLLFAGEIASEQAGLMQEMLKDLPSEYLSVVSELFSAETLTSSIIMTAVIALIFGVILLWLFIRDRINVKKGLTIALIIVSILLGLNDLVSIMAIVALILVAKTEKKTDNKKEKKEKKEISKLRPLKVTTKDLVWVAVLVLAYSTQFFLPNYINNESLLIVYDIVFNLSVFVLVIYIFSKRLKRDFTAFKKNFGSYVGYIFKWWGIMLGLSFVAAVLRLVLGGAAESANQASLSSAPLWYVGPLAILWAPVVEEGIFRLGLRRFFKNDKLFIVLSALLFGLLHTFSSETGLYNILVQSLQYVVMGGVMAYTYTKTDNAFVNMGIHCVQNTVGVLLMLLMNYI